MGANDLTKWLRALKPGAPLAPTAPTTATPAPAAPPGERLPPPEAIGAQTGTQTETIPKKGFIPEIGNQAPMAIPAIPAGDAPGGLLPPPQSIGPARRIVAPAAPEPWAPPHHTAAKAGDALITAARVHLFTRRGLDQEQAVQLATRCAARDLDLLAPSPTRQGGTGMAACMECDHIGRAGAERYRCGNWREIGTRSHAAALLPGRFVVEFHRCPGFAYATSTENEWC